MKRREVSQREENEAHERASAHRADLLARLQAREAERRAAPDETAAPPAPTPSADPGGPDPEEATAGEADP